MKTEPVNYYTLEFGFTDLLHKTGDKVVASNQVVRIGQQAECEVTLPNLSPYEDEQLAIIRPCQYTGGWQLVPISAYYPVKVNGTAVSLVHYLKEGDRITFEGINQELLFRIHRDEQYATQTGVLLVPRQLSNRMISMLVLLPVLLFGLLACYIYQEKQVKKVQEALLVKAEKSVYQLSVDSVFYMEVTPEGSRTLRRFSYVSAEGKAVNGTAFVTSDGFLITARHCIEPWLNDGDVSRGIPADIRSIPSRWALEAETYNQTHSNDTLYRVVTQFALSDGKQASEAMGTTYRSSDFVYDTTRDDIIEMGDFYHDYYWRSISRRHARSDMMLGDLAYMPVGLGGNIVKAGQGKIQELVRARKPLYFMGYPEYEEAGFEISEGTVKRDYCPSEMIAHNGHLIHGYSGGPVMAIQGDSLYVVGVISVIDTKGGDRMYSVPITEWKGGTNE